MKTADWRDGGMDGGEGRQNLLAYRLDFKQVQQDNLRPPRLSRDDAPCSRELNRSTILGNTSHARTQTHNVRTRTRVRIGVRVPIITRSLCVR